MHVVFRPPRPGTPEMTKVKAPPSMAASHAAQGQIKQGKNDFSLEQFDMSFQLLTLKFSPYSHVINNIASFYMGGRRLMYDVEGSFLVVCIFSAISTVARFKT